MRTQLQMQSAVFAVSTIVSANNDLMQQQKEDKQAVVDKKLKTRKNETT